MTKIVIKWVCAPALKALDALPETAIVAYHAEANLLYVRDDYADAALSYLAQAGIRAEVL